jgi:hypothetical protein
MKEAKMKPAKNDFATESRAKYWSEIDTEGKCKRLRDQVKVLQKRQMEMAKVLLNLSKHSHDHAGLVMIPLNDQYGGSECRSEQTGDDVYF